MAKVGRTNEAASTCTSAEIDRWIHPRAIEWSGWPTFISQPVVPGLFIFYPWHFVVIGLLCVDLVWQIVQHASVSFPLSEPSCLAVAWVKVGQQRSAVVFNYFITGE